MQLGVRDASRLLKVPESTVYQWVTDRDLPAQRINAQLFFNRTELLEWATVHKVEVSAEFFQGNEVRVATALQAGGIFREISGSDRPSALRSVVGCMPLPEGLDPELLWQLLTAREAHSSTAVGDGIAIPHPRSPIVVAFDAPTLTLCFLKEAIPFGAADGKPVQALFALLAPNIRMHLQLLARLASHLHNRDFRDSIVRRASSEVILAKAALLDDQIQNQNSKSE